MQRLPGKKRQLFIYFFLLISVVAVMIFTRRIVNPRLEKIEYAPATGDTIDVAVIYGPLSYYMYDDTLGGINFDILQRFAADTHTPMKFHPVANLSETIGLVEAGKYDLFASVQSDYGLKQRFLVTPSIFLDRLVLLQKKNEQGATKVNSVLDIGNDTIRVVQGSPAIGRLENLSEEIGQKINVEEIPGMTDEYLAMKVGAGEIPLAVVNENIAREMSKKYDNLSYDNPISFTQFQVWLINRNDSLLYNTINEWFESFRISPDYRLLIDKY